MAKRKSKALDTVIEHIIGMGVMLITALLFLPWWITSVFVAICIIYCVIEINWYYQPKDRKKRLIKADYEWQKVRKDNLAERLKAAEEEIQRIRKGK